MTNEELGRQIGHRLLGTCDGLINRLDQDDMEEALMDDRDFCYGLDQTAMLCDTCSWWFEPCDLDDDCKCEDCRG